jgi:adenine-specific DNA-methyltransferase
MIRKKTDIPSTPIESLKHKNKRINIPTEELRDFVAEDETHPRTVQFPGLLYARDPSLDPQLVWKGKDEQDQHPLEVPAVPIYIQEKIHPQAIVEEVRAEAKKGVPQQASLFADFNGLAFEDLVDFYRHEQNWTNRMILGDSLLVMTSLAEKEGLKGKVQMIYIDPPYGIKFGSNWQVSTRKRDVKDGKVEDLTRQPEQIKAFRDIWELGIHSYLTYLRDRLVVARELLSETGSVFVQIGDENVHLVRCLLDEVFGGENFISLIVFRKKFMSLGAQHLDSMFDYILFYAKDKEQVKYRPLFRFMDVEGDGHWNYIEVPDGSRRRLSTEEVENHRLLPSDSRIFQLSNLYPAGINPSGLFEVEFRGKKYSPPRGNSWKTNPEGMNRCVLANRIEPYESGDTLRYVLFLDDWPVTPVDNLWDKLPAPSDKIYVVQTSKEVIERCLLMTTDPGDLVLDPTCGSGTTAYVAEQWGRRWITVDTSRVALALARTRLMAARYPYYTLSDSPEGIRKEAEITGQVSPAPMQKTEHDIKKGFVYKRVPHITLKSIANNEEIDIIHAQWSEKLEPIREELNRLLKQSWEEWQIPRETEKTWPEKARQLLDEWWRLRCERQKEIDASIARHADTELLYDQPYEDSRRIRVTGPFTVESLSPHRVLSTDEEHPAPGADREDQTPVNQFEMMIIENLRKAGVQNTRRNERLTFDRLEPYAGTWLHAAGEYTDRHANTRRVVISIGPEHGTIGPEQVKEAAKEALRGVGFDLLVVCGFAFDAHAGETTKEFRPDSFTQSDEFAVTEVTKQYGKLPILLARINPDLTMGDELLKKTGAGNLFMVFGEPDIMIRTREDGKLVVEIRGVDVYDPTTGQIRSSSTDDIACWFIDTDYNEESFFVRHAYFTGVDEPYEKLKRALRAEIDEAAWSTLYSTVSRPFDPPETGKVAVKVINHYGDEVLKVYEV